MRMKKEEILAECIDEVRSGRSTLEDCLARYPRFSRDLRPLLEVALDLRPAEGLTTAEFRARGRAALLRAMGEEEAGLRKGRTGIVSHPWFALKAAPVALGILAAVVLAGGGTVFAAQTALPGDTLYPVKMASENVQVALTFSPQAKADLHLGFAQRRVGEAATEANLKRPISPSAASSVAAQLNDAIEGISKSKPDEVMQFMQRLASVSLNDQLVISGLSANYSGQAPPVVSEMASILSRGGLIASVTYSNPTFLATQPSVLDNNLEAGQFKLTGTVTGVQGQTWNFNGVTLDNVSYPGTPPAPDSNVIAQGITRKGKTFITHVEPDQAPNGQVTIQGVLQADESGGQVWNIGGVSVAVAPGTAVPPQKGDEVRLSGTPDNGKVKVSGLLTAQANNAGVQVDGTISSVDASGKWLYITQAGNQVKVNVSGAALNTDDNQTTTLSQLESSVGGGVQVKGLYKKDGKLYAKEVQVQGNGHGGGKK